MKKILWLIICFIAGLGIGIVIACVLAQLFLEEEKENGAIPDMVEQHNAGIVIVA